MKLTNKQLEEALLRGYRAYRAVPRPRFIPADMVKWQMSEIRNTEEKLELAERNAQ